MEQNKIDDLMQIKIDDLMQKKFEQKFNPETSHKIIIEEDPSENEENFFAPFTNEYYIDLKKYAELKTLFAFMDKKKIYFTNYTNSVKSIEFYGVYSDLTNLPDTITKIKVSNHNYTDKDFINLPCELEYLRCDDNDIYNLNNLPLKLKELNCSKNNIITLDNLPESVIKLDCSYNKLIRLDNLPNGLEYLSCEYNEIISLNSLPDTLTHIFAKSNNIISIDRLPKSLIKANFTSNPLISTPKCHNAMILLNYSLDAEKANFNDKIVNCGYKFAYGGYHTAKYSAIAIGYLGLGITLATILPFAYAFTKCKK